MRAYPSSAACHELFQRKPFERTPSPSRAAPTLPVRGVRAAPRVARAQLFQPCPHARAQPPAILLKRSNIEGIDLDTPT